MTIDDSMKAIPRIVLKMLNGQSVSNWFKRDDRYLQISNKKGTAG